MVSGVQGVSVLEDSSRVGEDILFWKGKIERERKREKGKQCTCIVWTHFCFKNRKAYMCEYVCEHRQEWWSIQQGEGGKGRKRW